ncbi:MAG TPA: M20/M25/M40 family metallo-hydrolase [Myxococcota bacterium]|nr:M20/M25/M40 family metallo-hydrolase [Myxococcota bacterium]
MFLLLAITLATSAAAQQPPPAGGEIRVAALRAHVDFLASDLLEGRGTATRGYALAASYVQAALAASGVQPAGTDGSWRQAVPLLRSSAEPEKCELVLSGPDGEQQLAYESEWLAAEPLAATSGELEAPLVFVGFGVSAPALGHDDYAALDVRGKIAVTLRGAPSTFSPTLRAFYSDRAQKLEAARAHGALGTLALWTKADAKALPWSAVIAQRRVLGGTMTWLAPSGEPFGAFSELRARAVVAPAIAERLFARAPRKLARVLADAKRGAPKGFALPWRARLRVAATHARFASDNVVGWIEGSDPELRGELVVLSAHLDHLGIGEPEDGDAIYNGAVDNAAGIATLLELARAIAAQPIAPRRSVAFLATTGEESGLLGSGYFAAHPTLAGARIVANLNVDGNALPFDVDDVVLYGEAHSTLGPLAREAAAATGWNVSPDPWPAQVVFIRSDQYSFVSRGIPALYPDLGIQAREPGVDGRARRKAWESTIYHSPNDEPDQPIAWETGERFARFLLELTRRVANADEAPRWNAGDFFAEKR